MEVTLCSKSNNGGNGRKTCRDRNSSCRDGAAEGNKPSPHARKGRCNYMESRPRIESSPSSSANLLYRKYSLNDIKSATGDFSEHLKVGEGDYGVVYKGEIEEIAVAVKIRREDGFTLDQQIFHQQMDVLRDVTKSSFGKGCGRVLE
ncbi:hypothetical protein SUGI_0132820 [Cryptomeria japonica]|nr:hypothetical protein SUGI_0132820 [Cryptomeria japonica]